MLLLLFVVAVSIFFMNYRHPPIERNGFNDCWSYSIDFDINLITIKEHGTNFIKNIVLSMNKKRSIKIFPKKHQIILKPQIQQIETIEYFRHHGPGEPYYVALALRSCRKHFF